MSAARRASAASQHAYKMLLRAYPPRFRAEFGAEMQQVFAACCRAALAHSGIIGLVLLWGAFLPDLAISSAKLRRIERSEKASAGSEEFKAMQKQAMVVRLLPYFLSLLFGLIMAGVNLHTDETPFVALPLALGTFIVGLVQPRGAWRWALLTTLWVPLIQLLALAANIHTPYQNDGSEITGALIGVLIFGFAGAYCGVLARFLARQAMDEPSNNPR